MNGKAGVTLRTATAADARAVHALVAANLEEGRLLPRTLPDITARITRFVVATRGRRLVGCAELAVLSAHVAEVRSLAVDRRERGHGAGTALVDSLRARARHEGFDRLCAFTHAPAYFIQLGFSIVPHTWVLEKLTTDCVHCPLFRTCGQYAMVVPIEPPAGREDRAALRVAVAAEGYA
jgi:amino-acid N-acetyltransferase